MAAARQKEMKVNITVVATKTLLLVLLSSVLYAWNFRVSETGSGSRFFIRLGQQKGK